MTASTSGKLKRPAGGKRVVVTGASGYLGGSLCQRILDAGHTLCVWGRSRPPQLAPESYQFVPYDLNSAPTAARLANTDVILHLAHDMDDTEARKINETATRRLRDAAREIDGLVFIYLSSQSARADAPSPYGRIKWRIEQLMDGSGEILVRPGFVYGGARKGAFGTLLRLLEIMPVFPVIGSKTQVQPVHVDDLSQALVCIVDADRPARFYNIAMDDMISFADFVKILARYRLHRRLLTVPVPVSWALGGAAFCRLIPGLPNVPRDRILGLTQTRKLDTTDSLDLLGLVPRDLIAGSRNRAHSSCRPLLREARVLFHYICGETPPPHLVRRYARALTALGTSAPLSLPLLSVRWPGLLRFSEPLPGVSSDLKTRLNLAVSLVEMTPQGVPLFTAYAPSSRLLALARLALTLAVEALALPFRMIRR